MDRDLFIIGLLDDGFSKEEAEMIANGISIHYAIQILNWFV